MTEQPPIVTVVIPTYNSSGTLRLSLETVLWQDFVDFEVWVVGDGCTDDSETIVSSFDDKRVHWVNLPANSGTPSIPRNEALRRARGRLVAYLGHDDLWFPWHLSELVDCIEKSNCDLAFSLGVMLGPEGAIGTFTLPKTTREGRTAISPSNWMHRKNLIEVVGPWSSTMRIGDDRNFLHRVLAANARLGFRQQLSVLKFPSTLWRMYSLTSNFPQSSYVETMRHNASELRLELLLNLARAMSLRKPALPKDTIRLPGPLRALIEWSLDLYGRERWPLNNFFYWLWRRGSGLTGKK
jgi:glycosyltransferase involved in cell wall biosynthesis